MQHLSMKFLLNGAVLQALHDVLSSDGSFCAPVRSVKLRQTEGGDRVQLIEEAKLLQKIQPLREEVFLPLTTITALRTKYLPRKTIDEIFEENALDPEGWGEVVEARGLHENYVKKAEVGYKLKQPDGRILWNFQRKCADLIDRLGKDPVELFRERHRMTARAWAAVLKEKPYLKRYKKAACFQRSEYDLQYLTAAEEALPPLNGEQLLQMFLMPWRSSNADSDLGLDELYDLLKQKVRDESLSDRDGRVILLAALARAQRRGELTDDQLELVRLSSLFAPLVARAWSPTQESEYNFTKLMDDEKYLLSLSGKIDKTVPVGHREAILEAAERRVLSLEKYLLSLFGEIDETVPVEHREAILEAAQRRVFSSPSLLRTASERSDDEKFLRSLSNEIPGTWEGKDREAILRAAERNLLAKAIERSEIDPKALM